MCLFFAALFRNVDLFNGETLDRSCVGIAESLLSGYCSGTRAQRSVLGGFNARGLQ